MKLPAGDFASIRENLEKQGYVQTVQQVHLKRPLAGLYCQHHGAAIEVCQPYPAYSGGYRVVATFEKA